MTKNDDREINPEFDLPEEILEAIPEEDRSRFVGIIKQSMFQSITRHSGNPIGQKVTSEHITQLIENSDEQDKRDRNERRF